MKNEIDSARNDDLAEMYPKVAGLWRRLLGAIIDLLFVTLLVITAGYVYTDYLVALGRYGSIALMAPAAVYFTLLHSKYSDGQTIGKKLMGTRLVGMHVQPVGVFRSFFRYLAAGLPSYLPLLAAFRSHTTLFESQVWLIGWFALAFALVDAYLLFANTSSRRSLHDYLAGTQVVMVEGRVSEPPSPLWVGHYVVCGLIVTCAATFGNFTWSVMQSNGITVEHNGEGTQRILQEEGIVDGGAYLWRNSFMSPTVAVSVESPAYLTELKAMELAALVAPTGFDVFEHESYSVRMVYGGALYWFSEYREARFEVRPSAIYSLRYSRMLPDCDTLVCPRN